MDDTCKQLLIGGQKSGKSARAEQLAAAWLHAGVGRRAVLVATAQAWDSEMRERIRRHQSARAQRVPGMQTVEEPLAVAEVLGRVSQPDTLVVVDCLTLWLTALTMPMSGQPVPAGAVDTAEQGLLQALREAPGPVVMVSNEIGLGVIPMGPGVRAFVDRLGRLNQLVAGVCDRVTFMAAGLPMHLKGGV